jgi:hypothetical protein
MPHLYCLFINIKYAFYARNGLFGLNIICINEESGRFKIIIEGQEWA